MLQIIAAMNLSVRNLFKIFLFVATINNLLAAQQASALFNGKNLDGWQQVGPGSFVVKDGMMKTEGGMGMLWYIKEKIGHASIRVVFKLMAKESDSGVFIRGQFEDNPN